ncbi:MAG TPA: hypothetical protein P5081_08530 [Phycisphaerae bacterium]|nr:hypothetical protein [Phycisphaerae bacterium]HRW52919.1 hypothetical protein [Phycisphaerae bacterium]
MSDTSPRHGPIAWVKRHPIATTLFTLFVSGACTLIGLDFAAERGLTREIAAIRARGEPTNVNDLRALRSPISAEENLAIALAQAARPLVGVLPRGKPKQRLLLHGLDREGPTGQRITPEQLETAEAFLSQNADAIQSIHDACRLETGRCPFAWASPLIDIEFDEPSEIRLAASILSLESLVAAERGDADGAARSLLECFHCAHAFDGNTYLPMIVWLTRSGMIVIAQKRAERVINLCGLSSDALIKAQTESRRWSHLVGLPELVMLDRVEVLDWFNELIRGPNGISEPGYRLMRMFRGDDELYCIRLQNELIDILRRQETDFIPAIDDRRSSLAIPVSMTYTRLSFPARLDTVEGCIERATQSRAFVAAIACERFRQKHDRWPETLNAIVPEFLDDVPIDLFDGNRIRYATIPEGIKTWSIGKDRVDDGGDVMRLNRPASPNSSKPRDVGWVILNPDRRVMAAPND